MVARNPYTIFYAAEELQKFAASMFEPPPDLSVYEWGEENIYLSERESPALSGDYSTALTPYVREPLQCFADRSVSDLTLCWGTQTSKTLTIMVGCCYRLANDPANTLWVIPNEKPYGVWFADNRWLPMLDNCKPLAAEKPPVASHRWKKLEQQFLKVTMSFVGSNSAANLAGRPIGLLVMDETDKFPPPTDREPGAIDNAEERTKTVPFGLHVKTSTPTTAKGEIWQQFKAGDQRYYFVPCPHCHEKIILRWEQVKCWDHSEDEAKTDGEWDYAKVRRNAHYKCQNCTEKIYDTHKTAMIAQGEWRPTNLDKNGRLRSAPGVRSYHLNSLYGPWDKCTFGYLLVSWFEKKKTPSGRQKFINSTLAEPWDAERSYDVELVESSKYEIAKRPDGKTNVMAIDAQEGDTYWVTIRAWASDAESWLQHEEHVMSQEGLYELQEKYGVHPNNVVIDMADDPNRIAKLMVARNWRGMWGTSKPHFQWVFQSGRKLNRIFSPPKTRDPNLGTRLQGAHNKPAVYTNFSKDGILDALDDLRQMRPRIFHIYDGVSKEYHLHMNAATKMERRNKITGRTDFYWHVKREDHLLTCEYMGLCCAMISGIITDASDHLQGIVEEKEPVRLPTFARERD